MLVEILVIDGCPHAESAIDVVGTAAACLGIRPIVKLVEVVDLPCAAAHCFVGSPTIRVNGRDVDPASHAGEAPPLACRSYATDRGQGVTPEYRLVHEALATARAEEKGLSAKEMEQFRKAQRESKRAPQPENPGQSPTDDG